MEAPDKENVPLFGIAGSRRMLEPFVSDGIRNHTGFSCCIWILTKCVPKQRFANRCHSISGLQQSGLPKPDLRGDGWRHPDLTAVNSYNETPSMSKKFRTNNWQSLGKRVVNM